MRNKLDGEYVERCRFVRRKGSVRSALKIKQETDSVIHFLSCPGSILGVVSVWN